MALSSPISHFNTNYPSSYNYKCPFCHYSVEFLYPGRKRVIKDFNGDFSETRYLYQCTNELCYNHAHPFNPTPKFTLSNKRNSFSVWKWIGRESKSYNMNASKIHKRIHDEFEMTISENTIRNISDEIDSYLTHKIDEETKKRVQEQGKIVLSLDGQKPEDGENALWLFVDLISNRVLDVQLLTSADHLTLHECVENILNLYQVELVGLLSDKQGSIVKMGKEFYSNIPHQYCQFHFLQNLWRYLESKDSSLQKHLATVINNLYITTISKAQTRVLPKVGTVNFREYFAPIEQDLRKLIKNRNKKFEKLRGVHSFDRITNYCSDIREICAENNPEHRVTKILSKTAGKIEEVLKEQHLIYLDCKTLFSDFKKIQGCLSRRMSDQALHDEYLSNIIQTMWDSIRWKRQSYKTIRATLPKKGMNLVFIIEQWYRMYKSYRPGLFKYYAFPIEERTNSKMEQQFGQEKMKFIQRSGKPNVSRQIRVRGGTELKIQYASKIEIKNYLDQIEGSYSHKDVLEGLKELQERQKIESNRWQSKMGGKDALRALFEPGKRKKKRT